MGVMGGLERRLLRWWWSLLLGVDVGCWDDLGCLECLDEGSDVVVKPVFEIGNDLCRYVGVALHCGVCRDVECTLGSFWVRGEASVL